MSPATHRFYISLLVSSGVFIALFLTIQGYSYYFTSLEERFYHPDHANLKPSGAMGHGLGIIGSVLILVGVFSYIARKRYVALARFGRLKYWLEFHIYLCSIGPLMILFHTAFKFGGIVSVSFWSMVAVVASGVIGRYIYLQIPRTIEGRELSLSEVKALKSDLSEILRDTYQLDEASRQAVLASASANYRMGEGTLIGRIFRKYFEDRNTLRNINNTLKTNNLPQADRKKVTQLVKNEIALNNRIERLQTMQQLFRYWHVVHLPFALIMLIIMVVHVGITLAFGYRWIF